MDTKYRQPQELFGIEEELHEDLKAHVYEDIGWRCLKHPLVFAVPYTEQMNAYYNESYKYKQDRLEEIRKANKGWATYIWLHERPYRINAFTEICDKITDHEYWEILGDILTDTENQWQWKDILGSLFASKRSGREFLMNDQEKELLSNLPDAFVVYRGHQRHNKLGYSWTLSAWRARWFAHRFQSKGGIVTRATVKKQDVYAVFLGRNEMEVAVSPHKLIEVQTVAKLRRPALVQVMLQAGAKEFVLGPNSVHGPWHWDKVERNAIALAEKTTGADTLVCRLFAVLHDCKRVNDNDDPQHGHRAAEFILKVKDGLLLKPNQLNKLVEACKYHNDGQLSDDPTIGVCWDADRLDLPRVSITPDPKLLSTAIAKNLIWRV